MALAALIPTTANCETGIASWYGTANTVTSTGKKLSARTPAAAHKTLPFGTKIRVTSLRTKKSVVAVIEDRGPFTKRRILDLNKIAASKLGMLKDGIVKVNVEIIERRANR